MPVRRELILPVLTLFAFLTTACAICHPSPCSTTGTVLECVGKIKSLSEIGGGECRGIFTLLLRDNNINELEYSSFALFPDAQVIDLRNNIIDHVSREAFSNLSSLQELLLDGNRISNLASLNLPTATQLSLMENRLGRSGELSGPEAPQLEYLMLRKCSLTSFSTTVLLNTPSLKYLDLSENSLKELESNWFMYASGIKELNVSNNQVKVLNLNSMFLSKVQVLDLSNNRVLETLDADVFKNMPELEKLSLTGTMLHITKDGPVLSHDSITHLSIASTFTSVAQLPVGYFSKLPALQWMDLSNNKLLEIEGVFDSSTSLRVIILSSNGLSNLTQNTFQGTPVLEELYLNDNLALEIVNVSVVEKLTSLRILDVAQTRVSCYCSDYYWELERWANSTGVEFIDTCGNTRVCEWEDTTVATTDTTVATTERTVMCWDAQGFCSSGLKCCPTGLCSATCSGATISPPFVILLLLGIFLFRMGS